MRGFACIRRRIDGWNNPEKTFQTIDHFAAADAWSGNFVGKYFPEEQRGQIAKWLFSQKFGADGNPKASGFPCGGSTSAAERSNRTART